MIKNTRNTLKKTKSLERKLEDVCYKKGQDDWPSWDNSRVAGQSVLQAMNTYNRNEARKMREIINQIGKLQQSSIKSFRSTFDLLGGKPIFQVGKVLAQAEKEAFEDEKRIGELEDKLQKQQEELVALKSSNSGMKAIIWEYDRRFQQADNLIIE